MSRLHGEHGERTATSSKLETKFKTRHPLLVRSPWPHSRPLTRCITRTHTAIADQASATSTSSLSASEALAIERKTYRQLGGRANVAQLLVKLNDHWEELWLMGVAESYIDFAEKSDATPSCSSSAMP